MKSRCTREKDPAYASYGGRGIRICERWLESFGNFLADVGERPPGTSLDRINNDGNYEPGNCRWATKRVQQNNMRTNHLVAYRCETHSVAEWSRRFGHHRQLLLGRLAKGWSIERALTQAKPGKHPFADLLEDIQ